MFIIEQTFDAAMNAPQALDKLDKAILRRLQDNGRETYDVIGERKPRNDLTLVIRRKNGEVVEVPMTCRLDTAEEVSIYEAGGVLQRFAQDFLEATA